MTSNIAIRVQNLSKCYQIYDKPGDRLKQFIYPRINQLMGSSIRLYHREFWAVKDVSFEVKRGETVGIIGRNGSGKSTLLQIICGTLTPTHGEVQTNGRIAALLELGSGFNPEFTGRENVYLNAAVLGLTKEEVDERFDKIADFAEIGHFINQPVKTYSSGMIVRLAFAVQSQVDPDILIVDEALAVGDEAFQRKCFARIEAIRDQGGTILFVSHSAQTVIQLCDRAILLDGGELLMDNKPKAVVQQYQKLVNTPKELLIVARNEIKQITLTKTSVQTDFLDVLPVANQEGEAETSDFYDLNLISKTSIATPVLGAEIIDFQLSSMKGQKINVMQTGKQYKLEIKVLFTHDCTRVDTGFAVKTPNGLILCGVSTSDTPFSVQHVDKGCTLLFSFTFNCHLTSGTYFVGFSVFGVHSGQDKTLLHRVTDALVLRVATDCGQLAKGYFDLEPSFRSEILGAANNKLIPV